MNPAYISALAALAGSIIGGLTSLVTTWLSQRAQNRAREVARDKRLREDLYARFVEEASRLYVDALGKDRAQPTELVKIYSMVSLMRIFSTQRVIQAAEYTARKIVDTYNGPTRTLSELQQMLRHNEAVDPLREFGEACRAEFDALGFTSD
jgi:hypothetical protein